MGIESGLFRVAVCGILVMIAAHHRHPVEIAHPVEALARLRVVTDDVTQRNIVGDFELPALFQDYVQRIAIGVNVAENCIFCHL